MPSLRFLLLSGLLSLAAPGNAVSLAHFGAAGQGNDDTKVIQSAIDATAKAGQMLEIPASTAPYNVMPLHLPSGAKLVLDAGVVVQALPGYQRFDRLLNINNAKKVSVLGTPGKSVFRMRKPEYTDEYRHCLDIEGASDVLIKGIECNDSGGDGLYIGPGKKGYSDHVTVEDSNFNNNRRQGLTIISGSDLLIKRCRMTNTNGVGASAGIDIEPNAPSDRVERVRILDCFASGNSGDGISMGLYSLDSHTPPVSVTIKNYTSRNNGSSGFYMSGRDDHDVPTGSVVIEDSSSTDDFDYGAVASFWEAPGPTLLFKNLTVTDADASGKTYDNAAIAVKRGGGGVIALGNVRFTGTTIIDTKKRLENYFSVRDWSNIGFKNIRIDSFRKLSGLPKGAPLGQVDGNPANSVAIPP